MKFWLDFGSANTGITLGALTRYACYLSDGSAADLATSAALDEVDSTNLPGLYILDAPGVTANVRGKAWVTATPAKWAVIAVDNAILENCAHGGAAATLTLKGIAVTATDTDADAVTLTANGSGNAVELVTGDDSGSCGVKIGGQGGYGIFAELPRAAACGLCLDADAALYFKGGAVSGPAVKIENDAGGRALEILATGGTADAVYVEAVGTNASAVQLRNTDAGGVGLYLLGGPNGGGGLYAEGNGASPGIYTKGGATGPGVEVVGGATSGDGVKVTATDGHGVSTTAGGADKHGIVAAGAGTGKDISAPDSDLGVQSLPDMSFTAE